MRPDLDLKPTIYSSSNFFILAVSLIWICQISFDISHLDLLSDFSSDWQCDFLYLSDMQFSIDLSSEYSELILFMDVFGFEICRFLFYTGIAHRIPTKTSYIQTRLICYCNERNRDLVFALAQKASCLARKSFSWSIGLCFALHFTTVTAIF